jgi:hypothetical protein
MTRSWRLPTALLISVVLLLAFSSIALPYKDVAEQLVIPDGADDLDYPASAGGSSPQHPGRTPEIDLTADSSASSMALETRTGRLEKLALALRVWQIVFKMGVSAL